MLDTLVVKYRLFIKIKINFTPNVSSIASKTGVGIFLHYLFFCFRQTKKQPVQKNMSLLRVKLNFIYNIYRVNRFVIFIFLEIIDPGNNKIM